MDAGAIVVWLHVPKSTPKLVTLIFSFMASFCALYSLKGFWGFSIFLPIKSEKQFMFKLNCNVDTQLTDSY